MTCMPLWRAPVCRIHLITSRRGGTVSTESAGQKSGDFVARESGQKIGSEELGSVTEPGHFYRGMSEAEYQATIGRGAGIQSNLSSSIPSAEGTNFASDARDAESYANYGRDDPRTTGKSNYLVEVKGGPNIQEKRDGYFHSRSEVPSNQITRVWKMTAEKDAIVAHRIK
jgi:hypothetical protein